MFKRLKKHVVDHKELYIGLAIGAGLSAVYFAVKASPDVIKDSTFVNSPYKSKITEVHLERRGHPGNVVRCIETGELFASQRRAAEALNINRGNLNTHLKGHKPSVKGLTFEVIGEAQK